MKIKIPDWYRQVSIEPSSERLDRIILEIEEIAKSISHLDIIQATRIFFKYDLENSEFCNQAIEKINKIDSTFTLKSNVVEFRLIMGALLYYIVMNSEREYRLKLFAAYSIISIEFENKKHTPLIMDIYEEINKFVSSEAVKIREDVNFNTLEETKFKFDFKENAGSDWGTVANQFEQIKSNMNSLLRKQVRAYKLFEENIRAQKEETNILWWIMAQYSSVLKTSLTKLKKNEATLIIAKELSDSTMLLPGPVSIKGFLDKAISFTKGETEDSLANVINSTDRQWRINYIDSFNRDIIAINTPITLAILNSLETEDEKDWYSFFKKKTNINVLSKFNLTDISLHFYNEILFLRLFGEINHG